MLRKELKELITPMDLMLKIVWAAFTFSVFMYAGVIFLIVTPAKDTSGNAVNFIVIGVSIVAVMTGLVSLAIRAFLLSDNQVKKRLSRDLDPRQYATNHRTGVVNQSRLEKIARLEPHELKLLAFAGYCYIPVLICLSLNEAIALLGFALSFVQKNPEAIIPFATGTLVLNAVMFPRLEAFVRKAQGRFQHLIH